MRATEACWALVAATVSNATVVRMARRRGCPLQREFGSINMHQSVVLHGWKALSATIPIAMLSVLENQPER